jgi:hypothetical protein
MLGYAADTLRGTAMMPGTARGRIARLRAAIDVPLPVAGLVVALPAWAVVQAPRDAPNYLRLAWGLLFVAYLIRSRVRPAGRMTALLGTTPPGLPPLRLVASQAPGPHRRAQRRRPVDQRGVLDLARPAVRSCSDLGWAAWT